MYILETLQFLPKFDRVDELNAFSVDELFRKASHKPSFGRQYMVGADFGVYVRQYNLNYLFSYSMYAHILDCIEIIVFSNDHDMTFVVACSRI